MTRRQGFGPVSVSERLRADRFFADLTGHGGTNRGLRGESRGASGWGAGAWESDDTEWMAEDEETTPVFSLTASVGTGGTNDTADLTALRGRFIALGYNWLRPTGAVDSDLKKTINLFQSIIAGRNSVSGDERVDVPGTTYRWLQATNAPRWRTMPAGSRAEGFFNYELSDTRDDHDFGTSWMAETIIAAGAHYRDNWLRTHASAALLTINDVSKPRGGDTPDHQGHECGLACDIRLPRTDGTAPGSTTYHTTNYDRDATRAMIQSIRAQTLTSRVLFNDPVLIGEGICAAARAHDDHVHFEIRPPNQGPIETSTPAPTPGPTPTTPTFRFPWMSWGSWW